MSVARGDRAGCVVLRVRGEVDVATVRRLRAAVHAALADGPARPVVLDLSEVEFLSSSGVGALLAVTREADELGRELRVAVGERRVVRRPLQVAGIDRVLPLYPSLDAALAGRTASE
jgi:anti-sigma B factor antagonist